MRLTSVRVPSSLPRIRPGKTPCPEDVDRGLPRSLGEAGAPIVRTQFADLRGRVTSVRAALPSGPRIVPGKGTTNCCHNIENFFPTLSLNRTHRLSDDTYDDIDWGLSSAAHIFYDPGTDSWYESRNLVTYLLPAGTVSVTIPDMGWNAAGSPIFEDVDHTAEMWAGAIADENAPDFDPVGLTLVYTATLNGADSVSPGDNSGAITVPAVPGPFMIFQRNTSPDTYGTKKPPPSGTLQVIPAYDPTMDPTPTGDAAENQEAWSPLPLISIRVCE